VLVKCFEYTDQNRLDDKFPRLSRSRSPIIGGPRNIQVLGLFVSLLDGIKPYNRRIETRYSFTYIG